MYFKLLGALAIEEDGKRSEVLNSDKGCALLAYLIITREPQTREKVADLIWDADSTKKAMQNLRRLLSASLRGKVPELHIARKSLDFTAGEETSVDLYRLEEVLASTDPDEISEGIKLYRGDLLTDFYLHDAPRFNEWLIIIREQLRQRVWDRLRYVCMAYETRELWPQGIEIARYWLTLDNLDESVHRRLMRFLAADGQIDAALAQYETCRQILNDEFGVAPAKTTQNLMAQIAQLARPQTGALAAPGHSLPILTCHFTAMRHLRGRKKRWLFK